MNAREFLNLLEMALDADGLSRDGDNSLTFFTNQAISLLGYSQNTQTIIFNENTGRLPVLNTTEGVFRYDAPDGYWKINGIWVEYGIHGSLLDTINPRNDYQSYTRTGEYEIETEKISGIKYMKIPYVRAYDAGDNTNAYILFTEDPGTTTDIYRWYALQAPATLLSDSMPLPIKPPYDMMYLFPAALELIRGSKNGKMAEAMEYVVSLEKKYRRKQQEGEQGEDPNAVDRGF
jgi:hypothetical protein